MIAVGIVPTGNPPRLRQGEAASPVPEPQPAPSGRRPRRRARAERFCAAEIHRVDARARTRRPEPRSTARTLRRCRAWLRRGSRAANDGRDAFRRRRRPSRATLRALGRRHRGDDPRGRRRASGRSLDTRAPRRRRRGAVLGGDTFEDLRGDRMGRRQHLRDHFATGTRVFRALRFLLRRRSCAAIRWLREDSKVPSSARALTLMFVRTAADPAGVARS